METGPQAAPEEEPVADRVESEGESSAAAPAREPAPDATESMALVQRIQAGDPDALEAFLRRFERRILRAARAEMGDKLRAWAEPDDVLQEVQLILASELEGFELRSHAELLGWVRRIVRNEVRRQAEQMNAAKRNPSGVQALEAGRPDQSSAGPQVAAPGLTPSKIVASEEQRALYDACVHSLEPESFRQAILLRDYDGADWDLVQRELGRDSLEATRMTYYRARVKLNRILAQRLPDLV